MKPLSYIIIGICVSCLVILYFYRVDPKVITKIEYRDTIKIDSLNQKAIEYKTKVVIKKETLYKYITLVKDSIVRDSIFINVNAAFAYQDSIIMCKDSIIRILNKDIQIANDSIQYYKICITNEKTKVKRWRILAISEGLILVIKAIF